MIIVNKPLIACIICLFLSACHTTSQKDTWPENIPDKSIFITAYNQQVLVGENEASLNTHLLWVKRFYRGLSIYPGWNDMSKTVLDNLVDEPIETQTDASKRLKDLGLKICIEWAKANDKRKIDSANINTWGIGLRKAVKQDQIFPYLEQVERDVEALIVGELDMRAITSERYHSEEDYNDF